MTLLDPLLVPLLVPLPAREDGLPVEDGVLVAVELDTIVEMPVMEGRVPLVVVEPETEDDALLLNGDELLTTEEVLLEPLLPRDILSIEDEVVRIEVEVVVGVVLVVLVVLGVGQLPAWVDVTEPVSVLKTVLVIVDVARLIVVDAVKAGVGGAVVVVITLIV